MPKNSEGGEASCCEIVQGLGSHLGLSQTKKRALLRGESGGGASSKRRDGRARAPRWGRMGPGAGPSQGRSGRNGLPLLAPNIAGRPDRRGRGRRRGSDEFFAEL